MMKLFVVTFVAFLLLSRASSLTSPNAPGLLADFSVNLARELHKKLNVSDKGLVFSPLSISSALTMALLGAKGETAEQMRLALFKDHLDSGMDEHKFHELLKLKLGNAEAKIPGMELTIASRPYVQTGFSIGKNYTAALKDVFSTRLYTADFKAKPKQAIRSINGFVNKTTHGKIKEILRSLPPASKLALVNAVYFKGTWQYMFQKNLTKKEPFYTGKFVKTKVEMMSLGEASIPSKQTPDMQIVRLPYQGGNISMHIFLPKHNSSLGEIAKKLNGKMVADLISRGSEHNVFYARVAIPKFKLETFLPDMQNALENIGIKNAFDSDKADFSGITDGVQEHLYLSKVTHKAVIEVNEEGSEAAAATAVVIGNGGIPAPKPPPPVFVANRPFIFTIDDGDTIFFAGSFCG